jgi:hypothetical protein
MLAIAEYNGWHQPPCREICKESNLACPFFMPTHRAENGMWLHASRLPLGCGWQGYCTAPGYDGVVPETQRLQEECSLGYSSTCPRLPADRPWDAIRFAVSHENESLIQLVYVCEKSHLPAEHGNLEYRVHDAQWVVAHADPRIQKKAECFLDSWLQKKRPSFSRENESENIHEQS